MSQWKRCTTCKKSLDFGATYYVCSVSTCNRKRTGLFFCSLECWEVHLPMARHREAWAVEETAPASEETSQPDAPPPSTSPSVAAGPASVQRRSSGGGTGPVRRRVVASSRPDTTTPREVLVVVSRFKAYIKERHGMNTSDGLFELLSDELRRLADEASDSARLDGRKTLLDRDFSFLRNRGGG